MDKNAKNSDLKRARALSKPDLAQHLEFVDLGGRGNAKVRLSTDEMRMTPTEHVRFNRG